MSFDNITLEKGMYSHPEKSFSEVLEELDPSENYLGSQYEGLDAFGRQLKRFNISVSGAGSDCISKFFMTTQSSALFPEYVSRAVKQGMDGADILPEIIATTTKINGFDYRTLYSVPSNEDKELAYVDEGAFIPETEVKTQDNLVKLHKRGRMLVASYEAIKYQKIDLFSVTLRQIGAYIAHSRLADAVSVLINGDGNNNEPTVYDEETSGTLSYNDLLLLYNSLYPYKMDRLIVSPSVMGQVLNISEFKNPLCGINFQGTGDPGSPLGAKILRTNAASDNVIVALDSSCALEMIVASDLDIEYDKLIDRQLERAAITSITGFAKIFRDATVIMGV